MSTRQRIAEVLLWGCLFLTSIILGASVYQRLAIIPEWGSDLPNSLITYFRGTNAAASMGRFWASPILPLNALVLIGALVAAWRDQLRRKWVIASAVFFFAALIWTGAWFVPHGVIPLMARGGERMSPEEITSRANAWIFWDWFRMGLTCGAFLAMTKSLTSRPSTQG